MNNCNIYDAVIHHELDADGVNRVEQDDDAQGVVAAAAAAAAFTRAPEEDGADLDRTLCPIFHGGKQCKHTFKLPKGTAMMKHMKQHFGTVQH